MSTVAQNRWIELVTVVDSSTTTASTMPEGWRWCYDASCASDADGGTSIVETSTGYISSVYGSSAISNLQAEIGSLIGMFIATSSFDSLDLASFDSLTILELNALSVNIGTTIISEPFKIGKSAVIDVPEWATQLILGFHDTSGWNDNHGSQSVEVLFDGVGPTYPTVYATQCIYFYFAPTRLLGPVPYCEDIDGGTAAGPHRPQVINVPVGSTSVAIDASNVALPAKTDTQLLLQRHLFNPLEYEELQPRQMLWKLGLNAGQYYIFIRRNNTIDNIGASYNCIACNDRNFTVVAIKKTVSAPLVKVMNALNRTQILPRRMY